MMFFGDDLSAADAERYGIANRVVPAADLAKSRPSGPIASPRRPRRPSR